MSAKPRLTVVIVNYNVKYFLDQCLHSVMKAGEHIPAEVIVVDNNSSDNSVEMVREKYPEVTLIANKENLGFSKANNQAIRVARGDYVLLLNPDTLVEEDTFVKCVKFMDDHPDAGGLGVKMVDGKGRFLPESKRGLPTPMVAFYKIFGLAALFPRSKRFGKYHLGYLDPDKIHKVDILAGAFMMMRKTVLDKTGLLDEAFFMYGEDIDLSWRIRQAGYNNYYFPETRIIHYKGESTKKSSINYVLVFYNAMIIFAKKHFSKSNANIFTFLIKIAIYLRATIALLRRIVEKSILPVIDFVIVLAGLILSTLFYSRVSDIEFPIDILTWLFPVYGIIVLAGMWYNGAYDKPAYLLNTLKGAAIGLLITFLFYAFMPESVRFSRAVMLIASILILGLFLLFRLFLYRFGFKHVTIEKDIKRKVAVVGKKKGVERVKNLLKNASSPPEVILDVYFGNTIDNDTDHFVAGSRQLKEAIEIFKLNEVVYCGEDIPPETIIDEMIRLDNPNLEYKIAPPKSSYIIGSQSISSLGGIYDIGNVSKLKQAQNKRKKRLLDVAVSLLFILSLPVTVFIVPDKGRFIRACLLVLSGKRSWVGLASVDQRPQWISDIPAGILQLDCAGRHSDRSNDFLFNLNLEYAKNYTFLTDLKVILSCWKETDKYAV